jgi:hypothetical protein
VPLAGARVQLSVRLTEALRLLVAAAVAYSFPAVKIRHGQQQLVTSGQPLLDTRLGIQWQW